MNIQSLFEAVVYSQHVMNYTFVAAAAVLICDYFTMLRQEIELIWFSKWTYTKVAFLVIRYTAIVGAIFILYFELAYVLPEVCKVLLPLTIFLLASLTCLAEAIFALRTWAIWQRHRAVGIILGILTVVNAVTQFVALIVFTISLKYGVLNPELYPVITGCDVTVLSMRALIIYPLVFSAVEAVVLTLMVISAVRSYRRGNKSKLSMIIHRDSILFYVFTLGVPLFYLLPIQGLYQWTPMALALYSTLAVRMILNMRRAGNRGMETELHELPVLSTQLRFAPAPIDPTEERDTETQTSGDLEDQNRSNDSMTTQ